MNILFLFLIFNELSFLSNSVQSKELLNRVGRKESLKRNYNYENNSNYLKAISINRNQLKNEINNDISRLYNLIANTLDNKNLTPTKKRILDIESDTQYNQNNVFFAEGNAIIDFGDGQLKADKFTYDKEKKDFIAEGNVTFIKGSQYFEASKFEYNFLNETGYVQDVYGVLDINKLNDDFDLNLTDNIKGTKLINDQSLKDLEYINSATFGLVNDFEENKKFNITDLKFEVPQITKWRFKTKKIILSSDNLLSKDILFTNDTFNEPQFLLFSKKFTGEKVDNKVKLISKNTWIILDQKFKFPIGRRMIFDRDPISKWSIGSNYGDMDGLFISRTFQERNLFNEFYLRVTPHFFIQRSLKGNSNSFPAKNKSTLSDNEKTDITFADVFGLDFDIFGDIGDWSFTLDSNIYSLDIDRFSEAIRSKFTVKRSFDLNQDGLVNNNFKNKIDFQIYSTYREKVSKGFSGEEEIYFANGLSLANNKSWVYGDKKTNLSFIYDFGEFKAENKNSERLDKLLRNVFAAKYSYEFPLWEKKYQDKNITSRYKYSPKVIKQGLIWSSNINAGLFLYSDNSKQEAITLSTGPQLTLGTLKGEMFDYTNLRLSADFIFKNGQSPYLFDDIDNSERIQINLDQQLFGPLIFSYLTYLNLDTNDSDYGKFTKPKYGLNIQRRAYSVGAFYDTSSESFGIQFNIFNFNYSGIPDKF